MSSQAVPSRPTLEFFPTAEGYYDYVGKKYVYQYKDHLGNIRLSYAKNPATQVLEIIEENNYYPFGLKHNGYNDYADNSHKYKYNGKELQDELGLNMYDYGARNYDPALGRWMNIDPLAEKSRRFSPYTYALNNPVYFIDPDGMEAMSPIYGSKGQFLGTDNQGFKGEVLFMSEANFILSGGQGMNHNTAMQMGNTLDQVIGDNPSVTFTNEEANMVNNAITDVVSKTEGYGFSSFGNDLHNGTTSSSYYQQESMNNSGTWVQSNDGKNLGGTYPVVANTDTDKRGDALVTYNLQEFLGKDFTVANLQNTWVHEYGNHFQAGVPAGANEAHAKAILNQAIHPTWKETTENYKSNQRNVYFQYTKTELKR